MKHYHITLTGYKRKKGNELFDGLLILTMHFKLKEGIKEAKSLNPRKYSQLREIKVCYNPHCLGDHLSAGDMEKQKKMLEEIMSQFHEKD